MAYNNRQDNEDLYTMDIQSSQTWQHLAQVHRCYEIYKTDNSNLVAWLVCLYKRLHNNNLPGNAASPAQLVAMARKIAKRLKSKNIESSHFYLMRRVIRNRLFVHRSHAEKTRGDDATRQKCDEEHMYYIGAIQEVHDILKPFEKQSEIFEEDRMEIPELTTAELMRRILADDVETAGTATSDDKIETSFEITHNIDGIDSRAYFVAQSIFIEMATMRAYASRLHQQVATGDIHCCTAAAAITFLTKRLERKLNKSSLSDTDKAYCNLFKSLGKTDTDGSTMLCNSVLGKLSGNLSKLEIGELVLHNCYKDMRLFADDFQKKRDGRPTQTMSRVLKAFDPYLDLSAMDMQHRLQWRKQLTICLLYDMVNVYCGDEIFKQRQQKSNKLEEVDWSCHGAIGSHRRLLNHEEFAGTMTRWAMQKRDTKDGDSGQFEIRPHHVFYMQSLVDSFTISRGWLFDITNGFVRKPLSSKQHHIQSIEQFLAKRSPNTTSPRGFAMFEGQIQDLYNRLRKENDELHMFMGNSAGYLGVGNTAPTAFKGYPNGLWEFAPLLCGSALVKALCLTTNTDTMIWQNLSSIPIILRGLLLGGYRLQSPVPMTSLLVCWVFWPLGSSRGDTEKYMDKAKTLEESGRIFPELLDLFKPRTTVIALERAG